MFRRERLIGSRGEEMVPTKNEGSVEPVQTSVKTNNPNPNHENNRLPISGPYDEL